MIRSKVWLLLLAIPPVFAQLPKPLIVNAVTDRYRPLALDQQKLTGLLASRIRVNSEGYLERVTLDSQASASSREFAGTLLDAAANAYEYRRHEQLRAVMDRIAKQLVSGPSTDEAIENSDDASVHRYELLGLIAYYRETGNESAFMACKKIANQLLKTSARSAESEPGVVLEPMVYLYRYTGDERYLDFCRSLAAALKRPGRSVGLQTFGNLTSLLGMVELYRITGEESYFRFVLAGWANIAHSGLNLNGAILTNGHSDSQLADACVTATWMQLTLDILRLTGDPRYAQQLERMIYNQIFAMQDVKTGVVFSDVQLNGTKKQASGTDECAANEARAISIIPFTVWGRYGNGIVVMQYTGGRATFQLRRRATVQIYSEATYPESSEILLHVEPSHNLQFPLRLRVPEWASKFVVDIAGSHLIGDPGEFITLNREWKRGDTVKIAIDMAIHIIDGAPAHPEEIAIQRGPQVLAFGKTLNPEIKDLSAAHPISTDPSQLKLAPQTGAPTANWAGDQVYSIDGEYRGKRQQLILVPFADAITYQIWMAKPGASSGAT